MTPPTEDPLQARSDQESETELTSTRSGRMRSRPPGASQRRPLAAALTLATLAVALLSADGQTVSAPAQIPLGTQTANVIPNIVMIFDDSGSMTGTFIYRS